MKKLLLLMVAVSAGLFAQTCPAGFIRVADTLKAADSTPWNGQLTWTLNYATTAAGASIVGTTRNTQITNGVVSFCLAPGNYTENRVQAGSQFRLTAFWVVPSTGGPYCVFCDNGGSLSIETQTAVTPLMTLNPSQISSGGATSNQCLTFNSTTGHWVPGACIIAVSGCANTYVLFSNSGNVGCSANFTFNGTSLNLVWAISAPTHLIGTYTSVFTTNPANEVVVGAVSTAASLRLLNAAAEANDPGVANGQAFNGINSSVSVASTSPANYTTVAGGGAMRGYRANLTHNGSGLVAQASGYMSQYIANNGTGSATDVAAYHSSSPAISVGASVTNIYGLWVRGGTVLGTLTNRYGVKIDSLLSGTNRWAFYADSDPSFFGGPVQLGSTTFSSLGTATGGITKWCADCVVATPCAGSGSGAWAFANGTRWACPF